MKNNSNQIITLTGENGEKLDFYMAAHINYDNCDYVVLKPVDNKLGLDPDEALVFRVESMPDGDYFELEVDDFIIDAVSEIYNSNL